MPKNKTKAEILIELEQAHKRIAELESSENEKRLRSMLEISQVMSASLEMDIVLQKIIENAAGLLQLESGAIYTLVGDELFLEATTPPLPPSFPDELRHANVADHPHIQAAISNGSSVVLADSTSAELSSAEKLVAESRGLRSIVYVPLMISEKAIGVFIVASVNRVRTFSEEEIALYSGFSGQAAQTIENVRLFRSEHEYAAELEAQIAERKQMENNLRESERKYRDLINGMNDAVWVIDMDMRFLDVNDAAVTALGYSRDELLFMKVSDIDSAIKIEQIQQLIDRLSEEKLQIFETRHKAKDGREIPIEVSSSLVSYMGRTVIMSIARDVTDRKQAEEEARLAERRYRALIENAPDGVVLIGMDGKFKYASPAIKKMFGYEQHEASASDPYSLTHPDDLQEMVNELAALIEDPSRVSTLQYRFKHKNGEWRWVESIFSNLLMQPGIEAIIINVRDIHQRKQTEEALARSQALLNEAQRIGRIGYMEWQNGNLALICSDEVYSILGLPRDMVITQEIIANMMVPAERDHLKKMDASFIQRRIDMDYEYRIRLNDGSMHWIHQRGKVTYSEEGIPLRMMAIIQDVTERKQSEEELRESRLRTEMALKGANAAMWDWNVLTGETIFNERWAEIIGYTLKELEPVNIKTWADLCHPDDFKVSENLLNRHFSGETEHYQCEARMKHKNGSWVWVLDSGKVMEWEEAGKPVRMVGTHLDITQQKREELYTQARLRLTNLSYETLDMEMLMRSMLDEAESLTDSQLGFFHFVDDDQNSITLQAWSTNTLSTLCTAEGKGQHYPVEQAGVWADAIRSGKAHIYNDYASLVHRKGLPEGHASITRLITLPVKRNNLVVAALGIGNKMLDYTEQDLEILQRFAETVFDIIMRKRAEEALRKNEERLRTVADFTYDMEFWMDENKTLQYMSPSCKRITGYEREQFLQDPSLLESIVHPDDRHAFDQHNMQEFDLLDSSSLDFRILTAAGEVCWISHTCQAVTSADGKFRGRRVSHRDITERRRVLQELRASEEKYRGLLESLDSVIATVDPIGKFLYMNDKAAEQLGGETAQFIGKTMYELFPEQVANKQMYDIQNVIEADRAKVLENLSFVNGQPRWYRTFIQPLHDEAGQVASVLVNSTDIHALKMMQQELQELNRTLEDKVTQRTAEVQDLYENAPTGYHSVNPEGKFVMVNQTELNWLGYTREEMLGHTAIDFITEATRGVFRENFPLLIQRGWVKDVEFEFVRKDGSALPVSLNATSIYDEAGNFIMTRSTVFDNTERKVAENTLRESEATYRALFENSNDGIFLMSSTGEELRANQRALDMVGYTLEEYLTLGHVNQNPFALETEQRKDADDKLAALLRGETVPLYERIFTAKDGHKVPVEVNLSPVRDANGTIIMVQSVVRDIAERKAAEAALRNINKELQRALLVKDEFLANMSHELRTPLNGILGFSEILLTGEFGSLNEKQYKYISTIESSGKHLLGLINDLLDLAKIEADKLDITLENVVISELCQASLMFVKQIALNKNIQLSFEQDMTYPYVVGDQRRLKQILVNLLSNAVKFTPEHGKVTLRVTADSAKDCLGFAVEDTGIGVSQTDLLRLFKPFTQVDSSLARQHEGTGLGLALVQKLAELHGGGVSVQSEVGRGSTFTVCIPGRSMIGAEERIKHQLTPEHSIVTKQGVATGGKILLAEDMESNIVILGDYLEHQGYELIYARNGEEALEKAKETLPDLILMDIQMPVMDGLAATRRLRTDPRFATVPIIALTALAMTGDRERCLEAGATEYVSKPTNLKKLKDMIASLLKAKA
ncbi:MAG: PAS domain S-box protein [Anaerolineae bacterium]|nr:PAS domain S-box protein [Anaerolineae bacterium]